MKIYLAARYRAKNQIKGYTHQLQALGFTVTSTWVNELHESTTELQNPNPRDLCRLASRDLREIRECDLLVLFTASPSKATRGGWHTELGYALGLGKHLMICGPQENIFHYLPNILRCRNFTELKYILPAILDMSKG